MLVKGKSLRIVEDVRFEVYMVDNFLPEDEFVEILKPDELGKVSKLSKKIDTNGKLKIISTKKRFNGGYDEIKYKVIKADWLVIYEQDCIQVFIKENFENRIVAKNRKVQKILDDYLQESKDMILNKRQFARECSELAKKLNVPFEIALVFKKDEESIKLFIQSIEKAIKYCFYSDSNIMKTLENSNVRRRVETLEYMEIYTKDVKILASTKISYYVHECLNQRKIIGFS